MDPLLTHKLAFLLDSHPRLCILSPPLPHGLLSILNWILSTATMSIMRTVTLQETNSMILLTQLLLQTYLTLDS